ncbi:MAG: sodium:solute symporter, partial [Calditrichia bacterium]
MTLQLHPLEILPIVLYLGFLLFLGLRSKSHKNLDDFVLGSRLLTLPAFVATLVTTWYGGILGIGEFTYLYGLSNWLVFGVPYYIFAILFAFFLAPKIRSSGMLSIPDQFFKNYGRSSGFLGTVFTFFMTLPAAYVLMLGLLIQIFSGWPLWVCVILGALFSMVYVLTGGFRAVVRTDKFQFILMFGGFLILFFILFSRYGGLDFLQENLPAFHLSPLGGHSWQYILVWFFIASWTFIDPGFYQRCYAAKSPATAKTGILWSVFFWFVFDFLTTSTGLYARALFTDLNNPALSFPVLSHTILPPLLSGLFLTGLLATIMSTVDSLSLLSAITIGYDFLGKFRSGQRSPIDAVRTGLVITAIISILVAVLIPSVVQIWYVLGTLFIPPMLLPLIACYFPRIRPAPPWTLLNLYLSFFASFFFLLFSILKSP